MSDLTDRQDAIDILKRNYPPSCYEDLCKAVDIAIKALSAQPEIIYCENCTYRKDNYIGDWCSCWCGWTTLDGHCHKGANKDE